MRWNEEKESVTRVCMCVCVCGSIESDDRETERKKGNEVSVELDCEKIVVVFSFT